MSDGFTAAVWLGVQVVLICNLWSICERWFAEETHVQRGIAVLILFWSLTTSTCFLLGLFQQLTGPAVFITGIVLATTLCCVSYRQLSHATQVGPGDNPRKARCLLGASRLDRAYLILWLVMAALTLGRLATCALFHFPMDWDSLMYHISSGCFLVTGRHPLCPRLSALVFRRNQ